MNIDKVGAALKRKLGPLPVWAWAIIGGIGLYWYRNRNGVATGQTLQPSQSPATEPQAQSILGPGESIYDPNTGQLKTAPFDPSTLPQPPGPPGATKPPDGKRKPKKKPHHKPRKPPHKPKHHRSHATIRHKTGGRVRRIIGKHAPKGRGRTVKGKHHDGTARQRPTHGATRRTTPVQHKESTHPRAHRPPAGGHHTPPRPSAPPPRHARRVGRTRKKGR